MAIEVNDKNLGHSTAYGYAKSKGYTGTEEEFAELMASYADVAEDARESADEAAQSASEAAESATSAGQSATATQTARQGAESAQTAAAGSASAAATSAGNAAGSATQAGQSATAATGSASSASQSATQAADSASAADTAKTAAETAQNAAESAQTAAETAQEAAEDAAERAEDAAESIDPETLVHKDDLEDYARIDGYYQDLTAGNAEQLISTIRTIDQVPYQFRTSGGSADIGNREDDMIVGGTVAWNQMLQTPTGARATNIYAGMFSSDSVKIVNTHKYLFSFVQPSGCALYRQNRTNMTVGYKTYHAPTSASQVSFIGVATGASTESFGSLVSKSETTETAYQLTECMMIDLTQTFGSTIADYIYSLEQATAGAGVAWFKKLFPKDYYEYNPGELLSVEGLQSHDTVEFNQWDEEWEVGNYDIETGEKTGLTTQIRCKNKIPVFSNTTYYLTSPVNVRVFYYDSEETFIRASISFAGRFTTIDNACYITFHVGVSYGVTYNHDICINLSWSGTHNGEYAPYVKHSYALDSSLTLRGIPKLDENDNLYYDGDTYASDGTVTRYYQQRAYQSGDENLADAITDGTNTVVKLATPTTEQAAPYTNPQIVDDWGTEEYVTDSIVPVGHYTEYPKNLRDKLQHLPDLASADGDYIIRQVGTDMNLVPLEQVKELPDAPTADGGYRLVATVSNGQVSYSWEAIS